MTETQSPSEDSVDPEMQNTRSGLIGYFAHNPVAANLLMIFILLTGFMAYGGMQKQMFPNVEVNWVQVQIVYPGASPQEIE